MASRVVPPYATQVLADARHRFVLDLSDRSSRRGNRVGGRFGTRSKGTGADANLQALKYVSSLLTAVDLKNIGKEGASLVPFVFDKIFRRRAFDFRFTSRSILATTLFWLIFILLRLADWKHQIEVIVK